MCKVPVALRFIGVGFLKSCVRYLLHYGLVVCTLGFLKSCVKYLLCKVRPWRFGLGWYVFILVHYFTLTEEERSYKAYNLKQARTRAPGDRAWRDDVLESI